VTAPEESAAPDVSAVQAAESALEQISALPVAGHVEVYEHVHSALQDALAGLAES
jgi:hypothetical protein